MSNHTASGKVTKLLFSHVVTIGILIAVQVVVFVTLLFYLSSNFILVYYILNFISIFFLIYLFSEDRSPDYKLVWGLVIMLLPTFGGLFYLLWGKRSVDWKVTRALRRQYDQTNPLLPENNFILQELRAKDTSLGIQAGYIQNVSYGPVYRNCDAEYFPLGEDWHASMLKELEKAEKFILLEYFIISPGKLWDSVLDILIRKARAGVKVYMLYDDAGSVARVPKDYHKKLQNMDIECFKFNPLRPQVYTFMNYRDHRKLMVIDGKVGYMGGTNLADEYINETSPHGHWKDTAVLIRGEAVWSLTVMFFQLWCFSSKEKIDVYKFKAPYEDSYETGFVQPYGDDPLDNVNVAENAYIDMINRAQNYVYITTPYLILDSEMISCLKIAASSGIDVRIIVPGIPDKWYVDFVTKSNYHRLLEAGVRIYEYTPGFVHAKMFVSDDREAIVGTANLDYRSLYLHFECCTAFYYHKIVGEVKDDIQRTLAQCREITLEMVKKSPWYTRFIQSILRILAPLM